MNVSKKEYSKMTEKASPNSHLFLDCLKAFLFGGVICTIGQGFTDIYMLCGMQKTEAATLTSVTLVFLGALLTSIGVYDKLAKHGGAGTLVPITGFANSVVSPAIEFKSEERVIITTSQKYRCSGEYADLVQIHPKSRRYAVYKQ